MGSIPSFRLKLDRAYDHLQRFKYETKTWIDTEPYAVVDEPDPEPPPEPVGHDIQPRRVRVSKVSEIPDSLSVTIGDCLFSLRAALDHLAFSLAKSFTPSMTDKQITSSEFPIFGPRIMGAEAERNKIGCVDPRAISVIKALQPYHRGNGYLTHPLWQIHDLNRIDKHRTLTICVAEPREGDRGRGIWFPFDGIVNSRRHAFTYRIVSPHFMFKLDAIWVRHGLVALNPHEEVSAKPQFPIEISFDQPGLPTPDPVIPTLESLCDFVGDPVISQLSQFL